MTLSHPEEATARTSFPSSLPDKDTTGSANSSAARLAKRALHHPPAVSELSLESLCETEGGVPEYPRGWKLASITVALCCAVFVGTLVCLQSRCPGSRALEVN